MWAVTNRSDNLSFPPGPRSRIPYALLFKQVRIGMLPFLEQLRQAYGDVVYFGGGRRRFYLVSDPEAIRGVLVSKAQHFIKSPILRSADLVLGQGLLLSEGDLHRRQRRLMQPAFHAQRVTAYAADMVALTERWCERFSDGAEIELAEQMTGLTLQIVAKVLFDAEIEADVDELGEAMSVTVTMFDRARHPLRWLLDRLPLPSNRRFLRAVERLHGLIDSLVEDRRRELATKGEVRQDLLTLLLTARDEAGESMTDQQVRDEAITLFAAGHETTANAMVWTWYLLASHPHVEQRLRQELAEVLGGRAPTAADLPRLTYTRAVLAESMRLYPPAWVVARQAVREVEIAGYTIPPEAIVLMSQWIVHRDARWFAEPLTFDPQRWLGEQPERPKYAYFPFGGGARSCIGEPFAWMEGTLLLATIAQHWRVVVANADRPVELHPTITLRPRQPMLARLERAGG